MTAAVYDRFYQAILDKDTGLAHADIKAGGRITPEQRMAIYIDGYQLRLLSALCADYPALNDAMGHQTFGDIAARYIEAHPSTSYNLDHYGYGFSAFVAANGDDFCADLAKLESAIAEVFRMSESEPLTTNYFIGIQPEDLGQTVLKPRAASRLLSFNYNVDDYLIAQRAAKNPDRSLPQSTYLYIHRHNHEVQRTSLSAAEYELLSALFSGQNIDEALNSATARYPNDIAENLQPWFAEWIQRGFFSAC